MNLSKNTERTLKALKKAGAHCDMVERFLQHAGGISFSYVGGRKIGRRTGVRKDLFGIIDIIALYPESNKVCGVQSCGQDYSAHLKKIRSSSFTPIWLCYAELELWGWRKLKNKWTPRIYKFNLGDFL